jgi:hypothetical protein
MAAGTQRYWRRLAAASSLLLVLLAAQPQLQEQAGGLAANLPSPVLDVADECATDQVFARQFLSAPRFSIADNQPLQYQVVPTVLAANRTEPFRVIVEFVGDLPTLNYFQLDGSEAGKTLEVWPRTATRSVDGRLISIFDRSIPANVLSNALRFLHGYDQPRVPIGEVELPGTGTTNPDGTPGAPPTTRRIRVRLAPGNRPVSQVQQFDLTQIPPDPPGTPLDPNAVNLQAAQYSSHVVNLHIPGFGDERVQGGDTDYNQEGVVQALLKLVQDGYDTVVILPEKAPLASFAGFHSIVFNDIQGINLAQIDESQAHGSNGVLRGTEVYTLGAAFDPSTFLHELGHQHGSRFNIPGLLNIATGGHQPSGHMALLWPETTLVGAVLDGTHEVIKSPVPPGGTTLAGSDFEIQVPDGPHVYHPLQLYAQGYLDAAAVPAMEVFDNQKQFAPDASTAPPAGTKLIGNTLPLTINDIQAGHGVRSGLTASNWTVAFVVVSVDGLLSQEAMNWYNFFAQRLGASSGTTSFDGFPSYFEATGGRATLTTEINPLTAPKAIQPLVVSNPAFGATDWRGLVLDTPLPSDYTPGEPLTLSGRVDPAIHGETSFVAMIARFSRYGDTGPGLTTQGSVDGGRFSFGVTVPSEPGRYWFDVFLFETFESPSTVTAAVTPFYIAQPPATTGP